MSKFQSKLIKEYKSKGYLVLKIIRLNENGYPDLLCIKENEPNLWVESKEEKDTLKPIQKLRIDELNAIGNKAICIQDGRGVIYPVDKEVELLNF